MTDNFDERLDDFKSKIDGFFDTNATHKLKVDLRDFTIQDIENVVSEQFRLIEARLKTFTDVIKAVFGTVITLGNARPYVIRIQWSDVSILKPKDSACLINLTMLKIPH